MQVCEQDGERIPTGIFRNMRMPPACALQAPNSKLLGTFENAIQGLLEKVRGRPYETIRCLGCRDGYYAVGLARLFPGATVYSQENDYLSSPAADGRDAERTAGEHELVMSLNSEQLATLNKVNERVIGYRDSQAGESAKPDTEELQFLYAQGHGRAHRDTGAHKHEQRLPQHGHPGGNHQSGGPLHPENAQDRISRHA